MSHYGNTRTVECNEENRNHTTLPLKVRYHTTFPLKKATGCVLNCGCELAIGYLHCGCFIENAETRVNGIRKT